MAFLKGRQLPASLIDTIRTTTELSTLYSYVTNSSKLFNLFNTTTGFTYLAPTNDAFTSWLANQTTTPALDDVEAILEYHLLNGSFNTAVTFTNQSQFAQSYLTNATYSNITVPPAGQRVEYLTEASGPAFLSSNMSVTSIETRDIICLGGLMQFVNSLLTIPISVQQLTVKANLAYFVDLLNVAQFLSVNDTGLIDFVNTASFTPNLTFFVPNSASSLAKFRNTTSGVSADELEALFYYHIVPDYVGYSSMLTNGTVLKTIQGDNVTITKDGDDLFVNAARITTPDYLVVNGVVHVIDSILDRNNQTIPAQVLAKPTSTPSTGLSTGTKAAIGVVVPVVVLALLAGSLFWSLRRKKAKKQAAELGTDGPRTEMGANPDAREMGSAEKSNEMSAEGPRKELDGGAKPTELDSAHNHSELDAYQRMPPAELE